MPETATKIETALRMTRIIAAAMLAYIPIAAIVIESVHSTGGGFDRILFMAIGCVSLTEIVVGLFLRRKLIENRAQALRLNSADTVALSKWRAGQIISFALAESIALHGLVFRVLGASLAEAALFYGVATAMLIAWWPQAP